jgi:Uma2 family endonuclease
MILPYLVPPDVVAKVKACVNELVTEDDTPVDNLLSEKQQRLLTEPLYSSWSGPSGALQPQGRRPFLVAANVGLFPSLSQPPLVPDVFLSLDVEVPPDWHDKRHRSYFFWEFGKPPEVVIEIVSNRAGNELDSKLRDYARLGITYYIVYDPLQQLRTQALHIYEKQGLQYQPFPGGTLPGVGLGLVLWEGLYEGKRDTWLRWCDVQGQVIPTGAERAEREAARAEQEAARAEREAARAEREAARAEQEAAARQYAEAELARLRAELARLQQHPGSEPESA